MATYWIVVGGAVNFDTARERGFDMFGFKSTRRKESALMQPGDKLIFYLTGVMQLGGIATITSEVFEDHSPVFVSKKKPQEDYPFRVQTEPDLILAPGAVPGGAGDWPAAGVHEEVAAGALAAGLPGQPASHSGGRLRAHPAADGAGGSG